MSSVELFMLNVQKAQKKKKDENFSCDLFSSKKMTFFYIITEKDAFRPFVSFLNLLSYMYRLMENNDICQQRNSCVAFLQENGRPNTQRNMNK